MKCTGKIVIAALLIGSGSYAQDTTLLETKHFHFHSNSLLNLHLFLYKHATALKSLKLPDDSLQVYLQQAGIPDSVGSHAPLMTAIKYYRDSLTTKDLLFDSTMRQFSVMLVAAEQTPLVSWQVEALQQLRTVQPFFTKALWPSIDAANRAWVQAIQSDLTFYEAAIINRLQKLYGESMPNQKIRVDLSEYASWAGACSYSQGIDHILIANSGRLNQGRLGVEIVFHEGSHFLIDPVYNLLTDLFRVTQKPNTRRQTWHNLLFYTTGHVVSQAYASQGIAFIPYYQEARFDERLAFRLSTKAFSLYWDPYMRGETTMEDALKKVVEYIVMNEQ